MKTHEIILAIVLALALGVFIEIGGYAVILFLGAFSHHMVLLHFWMLLHRPIQRLVMLLAPYGRSNPYAPIILYYLLSICAWGALSFAGIWMFYRVREPDEKN